MFNYITCKKKLVYYVINVPHFCDTANYTEESR